MDAVKISDFVTDREWKSSELYNEFFRELGITSQLAFLFKAGSIEIGFAANRTRKDFSESERLLLSLLQPHFHQAHANAKSFERARRASDFSGGGTVVFSGEGAVLFWSAKARMAIARFYPDVTGEKLPEGLLSWVRRGLRETSGEVFSAGVLHPLTLEGEESTFIVRLSPNFAANEHVLTIEEQPKKFPISIFTRFGHSPPGGGGFVMGCSGEEQPGDRDDPKHQPPNGRASCGEDSSEDRRGRPGRRGGLGAGDASDSEDGAVFVDPCNRQACL